MNARSIIGTTIAAAAIATATLTGTTAAQAAPCAPGEVVVPGGCAPALPGFGPSSPGGLPGNDYNTVNPEHITYMVFLDTDGDGETDTRVLETVDREKGYPGAKAEVEARGGVGSTDPADE